MKILSSQTEDTVFTNWRWCLHKLKIMSSQVKTQSSQIEDNVFTNLRYCFHKFLAL